MRRLLWSLLALALAGLAGFWLVTRPQDLAADAMEGMTGDASRGEQVFWAAGCASCHAAEGAKGDDRLRLGGGRRFPTPFGTFVAPNISPDPVHGIGAWSARDLARAMTLGVSPDGRHYYPVFPYTSYARATLQDIADLRAFLATLPPVAAPSPPHETGFPFSIRRTLGVWKALYLDPSWVVAGPLSPDETRGRYLVEALGHCGECHTPRDALGGPDRARWLAGGPVPAGQGRFPNITPARLKWTGAEIADYLETGFTPDFDSAGGHMALVVENFARLPAADRAAVASYLKKVPPVE
ncbi:MAG: cytochrome c [Rhodobacteraceae bacterium]|nr:cytochrome c [Paracoccaceae bacterium]